MKKEKKINSLYFLFFDTHIPFLSYYIKRSRLRFLRGVMRGHNKIKKNNEMTQIYKLLNSVEKKVFYRSNKKLSPLIFGDCYNHAEHIFRRYLFTRTMYFSYISFVKSFFYHIGTNSKISCTLPIEWREVVEEYGFEVNHIKSQLYWFVYIISMYCYGIFEIKRNFVLSLINIFSHKKIRTGKYVYFYNLDNSNLPKYDFKGKNYDVISWYDQLNSNTKYYDNLAHSANQTKTINIGTKKIIRISSPFPFLNNYKQLIKYSLWGFKASIVSLFDIFRGRWWNALMLAESSKLRIVKLIDPKLLAKEYLFSQSNYALRPLWTYQAESYGSKIILYFYSTNIRPRVNKNEKNIPNPFLYLSSNWPNYLVWDKEHEDFMRKSTTNNPSIKITGPIPFQNFQKNLLDLPKKTIAIFDVQPFRETFRKTWIEMSDFYIPQTNEIFMNELYKIIYELGGTLAFKNKRDIGKLAHYKYRKLIDKFNNKSNFVSIDPSSSAYELIEKSKAVVSMPFTSTALIAKHLGKPSIYYDPRDLLHKNDIASHGIRIISDLDILKKWVSNILN